MSTPYSNIYKRFLSKITDIDLANKDQTLAEDQMYNYLISAIVDFKRCKKDLTDRDENLKQFNQTLSEYEEEILSMLMVVEWLNPYINNIMMLKQVIYDNDFKIYSQAQHLHELINLKDNMQEEAELLITRYTYDTADLQKLGG